MVRYSVSPGGSGTPVIGDMVCGHPAAFAFQQLTAAEKQRGNQSAKKRQGLPAAPAPSAQVGSLRMLQDRSSFLTLEMKLLSCLAVDTSATQLVLLHNVCFSPAPSGLATSRGHDPFSCSRLSCSDENRLSPPYPNPMKRREVVLLCLCEGSAGWGWWREPRLEGQRELGFSSSSLWSSCQASAFSLVNGDKNMTYLMVGIK